MDKAQTRKRQNRTTHISSYLSKTQSIEIELKNNTRELT